MTGKGWRLCRYAIFCATAGIGFGYGLAQAADEVLLDAAGVTVTLSDVRANLATLPDGTRAGLEHDPEALQNMVRLLAAQKIALQRAQAKNWESRPDVAAAIAQARDNAILQSFLAAEAKLPAGFPSDSEVKSAYDANKPSFAVSRRWQLAQIFVAKGADAAGVARAKEKLAAVESRLKLPEADFGAIAAEFSDDAVSAKQQGTIGLRSEREIPLPLLAVINKAEKDRVTAPILLDDGWHILKVMDILPPSIRPLEEVRPQLVAELRNRKLVELQKKYIDALAEAVPKIDVAKLSHMLSGEAAVPDAGP